MLNENVQENENSVIEDLYYQSQIYDSVLDIPSQEWNRLSNSNKDLAMNQKLIHLMEKTLSEQAKFWTIAFRNQQHQLVACANLSLFQSDIIQSAPPFVQKLIRKIRAVQPNLFRWNILFCGLPIPSGHSQLRFLPGIDPKPILMLLNEAMQNLAKQQQAKLIVLKEFDSNQATEITHLTTLGFCQGELAPLFVLQRSFKDFADYLTAIRSNYKHQIQSNIKKFKQSNLRVEHIVDPHEIRIRFTEQVYQLYLNIWEKAKEKLECLTLNFFQELPHTMPTQIVLTLISDHDNPVAFAMSLVNDENYYNLYTGMDYSLKEKTDLYFNLFYHEIDYAFGFQKKWIFLGQTSDHFKARLGAIAEPRFFFVRARNPILQIIFKLFRSLIFPKLPAVIKHDVFK